jgi:SPP1 gp7 family putative phage head morphogenesis protein
MPVAKRVDPSRTMLLQTKFANELAARQEWLKEQVTKHILHEDSYGLGKPVANADYQFLTDSGKLKAFSSWLQDQIDAGVLMGTGQTDAADPLTIKYIQSAYKQGVTRAYLDAHSGDLATDPDFYNKSAEAFLAESMGSPIAIEQVQLLATRTFEEMKGLTNTEKTQLNRILADGLANGSHADEVARDMTDQIDGLTRTRANVIARTEIVRAHAEGQLDSYQKLDPTKQLGVEAEWSTADDDLVCDECFDMAADSPYTIDEARGLIPAHPNCRCSWIPYQADLEEQPTDNIRRRVFDSLFKAEGLAA